MLPIAIVFGITLLIGGTLTASASGSPTRLSRDNLVIADPNAFAPINPFTQVAFLNINDDRARNGSPPLQLSPEPTRVRQTNAEFLMGTNTFAPLDPVGRNPQGRARSLGGMSPRADN